MSADEPITISAKKLSYTIPVSKELLISYGLLPDPRSPEERKADHDKFMADQAVQRTQIEERHAGLLRMSVRMVRDVLELHAPVFRSDDYATADCHGCDFSGYEGEAPEWPCRTYELISGGDS